MIVMCPKCGAENRLPDSLDRRGTYRCHLCKTRFTRISRTNFRLVAALTLAAWWVVPPLLWAGRHMIESAPLTPYINQEWFGNLFLFLPGLLLPWVIVATAYFLWQGFRHERFTGVWPRGYGTLLLVSVLGPGTSIWAIVRFYVSL
jgi:hypothetical protein